MAVGDQMPIITIKVGKSAMLDDKTQYQLAELFRQIGATVIERQYCPQEQAEYFRVQVRPNPSRSWDDYYTLLIEEDGIIRLKAGGGREDVIME